MNGEHKTKSEHEAETGTPSEATAGHRAGVVSAIGDYLGGKPMGTSQVYSKRRNRDRACRRAERQRRLEFTEAGEL